MSENSRENEVVVMMHGKEVLRLDTNGDVVFQGNFVAKDAEASKRFFTFFQNNLTRIIEGDKAAEDELNNAPEACGTCSGC